MDEDSLLASCQPKELNRMNESSDRQSLESCRAIIGQVRNRFTIKSGVEVPIKSTGCPPCVGLASRECSSPSEFNLYLWELFSCCE